MDFRTKIPSTNPGFLLTFSNRMMVLGSCFAENIGNRLDDSGFSIMTNPFGVLYNPSSISSALRRLINSDKFRASEIIEFDGLFHSFSHHGFFSGSDAVITLDRINESFNLAVEKFKETDCLMLTFGTAWVYALTESGQIVANCHKFPANNFKRLRLTVDDITLDYTELFDALRKIKPDLKIILTVSPIRHWKDGVHENTVSKSVLHLAADNLCKKFENVVYYPSYELMMDDLRDYRFYDVDMLHPSLIAQDYIWEHFSETFMARTSREMAKQVQQIRKAMNHRPLHDDYDAYVRFAQKNIASIEMLKIREPEIDLKEEMAFFENILKN